MEFTGERFILGKAKGGIETEHLHRYLSISELVTGKKVLDAACGEGFGSSILARTANIVWGIDISEEAVNYANDNYKSYNLNYRIGSIEKLEFEDNSFDVVVSYETIEHVEEGVQNKFLLEVKRVLKDDGILIISTPDKYLHTILPNHINPYHKKEFYYNEFIDFLQKYFKNTDFYNQSTNFFGLILNYNKNFKDEIKYINETNNSKTGKYIIAICSDAEITNKTIINSLFEENDDFQIEDNYNDFFQIYLNNDKDFIEYNSSKTKYDYKNQFQTLCFIMPDHSYGKMRLDLGNRPCIVELKKKITLNSEEGASIENIQIDEAVGIICLDEDENYIKLISMSDDPQLILSNRIGNDIKNLKIFLDIKIMEFDFTTSLHEINSYLDKYKSSC